MADNR